MSHKKAIKKISGKIDQQTIQIFWGGKNSLSILTPSPFLQGKNQPLASPERHNEAKNPNKLHRFQDPPRHEFLNNPYALNGNGIFTGNIFTKSSFYWDDNGT